MLAEQCETEKSRQNRRRRSIVIEEKGKQMRFDNPTNKDTIEYRVDGCLITGAANKCDFLLVVPDLQKAFFVELKGTDVPHAMKQVANTIQMLSPQLPGFHYAARIICSGGQKYSSPNVMSSEEIKLAKLVKKDYKVKSNRLEETI